MFETCETLMDLNAERAQLCTRGADIVAINNAYNVARQRIINSRNQFIKLVPKLPHIEPVEQYCSIPIAGRSTVPNTIILSNQGFLY